MPSITIWPPPRTTRPSLESAAVTNVSVLGSSRATLVDSSSDSPSGGAADGVDADASDRLGSVVGGGGNGDDGVGDDGTAADGTVTGGAMGTPPTVAVGVETDGAGTGIGVGIGIGGLVAGAVSVGTDRLSPRRPPHFAFQPASICRSLRSNPLGAANLVGALGSLNGFEASDASALALNSPADASAYGCPWVPYVALPESPGQRASAYCGCWKLPAAAVCPIGPVSAGLAVPSANGELSTCVCAIE